MRSSWESNSAKAKKGRNSTNCRSQKEELDTTQNETRKEPIASEPFAMDTIVITKIDTVYMEAPVVEAKRKELRN